MLVNSFRTKLISSFVCAFFLASQAQGAVVGAALIAGSWCHAKNRSDVTQNSCGGYNMNTVEALGLTAGVGLLAFGTIGIFTGFGLVPGIILDLNQDIDQINDAELGSKLAKSIPELSSADRIELAKLVKANQNDEEVVDIINEFLEDNGYAE